jgi:phage terminase small subunit
MSTKKKQPKAKKKAVKKTPEKKPEVFVDPVEGKIKPDALEPLSVLEERFCREYMVDGNGSQAAARAGYSEHTSRIIASQLLTRPRVALRIAQLQEELRQKTLATVEGVMLDLHRIKSRCMEAEPVMMWDRVLKSWVPSGVWKFDSKGAVKAVELLGTQIGMFQKKMMHANDPDNPMPSPVQFYIPDNGRRSTK